MSKKPLIKIKDLKVTYFLGRPNEVRALKNINLEIYPGEFVIFFGPSGCGKSTLLYSIADLEKNTQGNIHIDGSDISKLEKKELEKFHQKKIGMIFQAYYLINSLSVLKNVILPQMAIDTDSKEREKKALKLLEHFGVKEQANKLPNELSGGQQQRVAICRALINDPEIILADEPVGNLDSKSAGDVMNLIKELNVKQKKTIILVTHNPANLNLAHRVFYMKDGGVIDVKVNKHVEEVSTISNEENEAKGGSKIGVSKEMELLARTFSSISSHQFGNLLIPFKAQQIAAEVLTGMTSEEIDNVEKKIENLLMNNLVEYDDNSITEYLDVTEEEGGVGLDKRTAKNLSSKIKDIVKEVKVIEKNEKELNSPQSYNSNKKVVQIRQYLLDTFSVDLRELEVLKSFDKVVKERLNNKIGRMVVQKQLDLSIEKGGVGLDKRVSRKIAKRLELLMLGKYK